MSYFKNGQLMYLLFDETLLSTEGRLVAWSSFIGFPAVGLNDGNRLCRVLNVPQAQDQQLENFPISEV